MADALMEAVGRVVPQLKAETFVTLRPAMAAVELKLDFSLYSRANLDSLELMTSRAGARFVEMMKLPEDLRDPFRKGFLTPATGEPITAQTFGAAAAMIKEHLAPKNATAAKGATTSRTFTPSPRPAAPAPTSAPAPQASDARREGRYEVRLDVAFKTEAEFVEEYATNISSGGLFIRTSQRPAPNSEVRLTINLPNGEKLNGVARVVHVVNNPKQGGVGIKFAPGDQRFEAPLQRYFATLGEK